MAASAHRKIELQSPDDLRYLLDNVTRAARQKLDLNFPPSAAVGPDGGQDALRLRIEEIVLEYVRQTFSYAGHSISVNGMDNGAGLVARMLGEEETKDREDFEPFDTKLAGRVQALHATLETLTLATTELRRTAPARAADAWRERHAAAVSDEEDVMNRLKEGAAAAEGEDAMAMDAETLGLKRAEDVQRTWGRAVDGLVGLKTSLPGTAARLERAEKAVNYVEGR